ncbi:precorrin-3B synthase [Plantactinospora sp. S1510]|uniref:Precorrin-3B synthase n=1 Tax=Plantactinospora alkalitolerans TaxID=2789879 RepID=A0ABS0H6D9_9ACTN|nr:precorrin-3B synthase [Plantactinospora alkalitolerans]MBF9133876.1 precorrin-3B synthase [Plantactinospora alkalitolerans]
MSVPVTPSPRSPEDRCPGALRAHQAADGLLVRVRLPGGQLRPDQLRVLAEVATTDGDGTLELTSRANLQIRGLPDDDAVRRAAERIATAGLLPTPTHERVRNLLASPLSGRDGSGGNGSGGDGSGGDGSGRLDVRPLVRDLDAALRAAADLASLSGRFLFALDDGRYDVATLGADLCWIAGADTLRLAGTDTGLRVGPEAAVELLIEAARAFLRVRGDRRDLWRLADLPDGPARVTEALGRPVGQPDSPVPANGKAASGKAAGGAAPEVGVRPDGLVVAGVRLGRLTATQARVLADLAGTDEMIITPWRSVVLDSVRPDTVGCLVTAGLLVEPSSPWLGVTACTGRPGCASALADVRQDLTDALADGATGAEPPAAAAGRALPVHVVGCDRCCGRPVGPAVLAVATGAGYRIEAVGHSWIGTPSAALAARAERQL